MPILPTGARPNSLTIGGSPRGWTFISTAECWYRFALRYVLGYFPAAAMSHFDLGSTFHGLMEGGEAALEVAKRWPEHLPEAQRLANIRRTKGPPLAEATAVERTHVLFNGKMTSKPDREEAGLIRDYKTSAMYSEYDEQMWNVNGGIIGEIVAGGVEVGLVDIVSKRKGKNEFEATDHPVKIVTVRLTPAKKAALEAHVDEFWRQLEERVRRTEKEHVKTWPRNINACVGKYGPCEYYGHCWGKPPESLLYRLAPEPPRRWVSGSEETGPLKLPGKLTVKLIEKAYTVLKKHIFGGK